MYIAKRELYIIFERTETNHQKSQNKKYFYHLKCERTKTNSKDLYDFYEGLNTTISSMKISKDSSCDLVLKPGDFNAKVGKSALSSDDCYIGKHSRGQRNTNEQALIDWYNIYK